MLGPTPVYEVSPPSAVDDLFYQKIAIAHEGETLHLQRIFFREDGPTTFMLHGSLGNGRVFYSHSGKGLGPYLARQGFDVYVGDLRGRGQSYPSIGPESDYGQTESITEELPAFHAVIADIRAGAPLYWAAHSWGGTLLLSYLARFPEQVGHLRAGAFFGSKRVIHRDTFLKRYAFTAVWDVLGRFLVWLRGYLSGRWLRFSDDCDTRKSYRQTAKWLGGGPWIDEDGFDYAQALSKVEQPPILHLSGARDTVLGAASDIARFILECDAPNSQLRVVGKTSGHRRDYAHLDILIHPDGPEDHFPEILEWFENNP